MIPFATSSLKNERKQLNILKIVLSPRFCGPRYIISSSSSRVLIFFCATLLVCTFFRETGRVSAGFFL